LLDDRDESKNYIKNIQSEIEGVAKDLHYQKQSTKHFLEKLATLLNAGSCKE